MTAPIFKVLSGPLPTQKGLSNAITAGLAPALSAGSKAADLFPHDEEGLLQILHFRNQIAKNASRRARWFGGRLFNRFSGEDGTYIPLSGTHLRQTLDVAGIDSPSFVVASGQYLLRLDISERAAAALKQSRNLPAPSV
ncbi:hypothetical protein BDE40_0779 [Litoreibacter halocynthiae]|uniref:Uncharacterized protein n=1 Tax=Litoreibacter halocynthiae TaxID=1242689 RepID=A0A4R7LRQ0_9RHOB|nr:hypothetical protein [Litoreibacter halocynthiae]TDT77492.1 hypothetical protein BDE40_0779 [Litoreibacter halocynthiae]